METLKSGDAPALVTNIEVLQILSERSESRNKALQEDGEEENRQGRRQRRAGSHGGGQLQHRDWIEEKVYEYLQATPCASVDINEMPKFVSALKGKAKDDSWEKMDCGKRSVVVDDDEGNDHAEREPLEKDGTKGIVRHQLQEGFGLTDAETLQVLNLMPQEMVEIHLMIEDLSSRMSEERQQELLDLVGRYAASSGNENTEGAKTGEDEEMEGNVYKDDEIGGEFEEDEYTEHAMENGDISSEGREVMKRTFIKTEPS